ncbi:hypothetical protein EDC14_10101 [Hydrogenispora ethanolica]|uniref:Uncharacterized protein n=1 Tax=Hydrogenispora ethanolica TaxID=1082276 RepID=A0A4R1RVN9_HYDET|nr:hypothetical protein [Hydrogenispora ethanolica]TCL70012.1 hypothetical protein EDC14_10101 [Hydrogenispora ethanolica]
METVLKVLEKLLKVLIDLVTWRQECWLCMVLGKDFMILKSGKRPSPRVVFQNPEARGGLRTLSLFYYSIKLHFFIQVIVRSHVIKSFKLEILLLYKPSTDFPPIPSPAVFIREPPDYIFPGYGPAKLFLGFSLRPNFP